MLSLVATPRAEGSHEGVVLLTPQDHYVRVRLVQVVVDRGKVAPLLHRAFHVLLTP